MAERARRRVLLLHSHDAPLSPDWRELEQRLRDAEHTGDRETAVRCLEEGSYSLIVSEATLPGGGPFGLLREIIARQQETTVVVHFRLDGNESWLKLFEQGAFDLEAKPLSSKDFFHWLEDWLVLPQANPALASTPA